MCLDTRVIAPPSFHFAKVQEAMHSRWSIQMRAIPVNSVLIFLFTCAFIAAPQDVDSMAAAGMPAPPFILGHALLCFITIKTVLPHNTKFSLLILCGLQRQTECNR